MCTACWHHLPAEVVAGTVSLTGFHSDVAARQASGLCLESLDRAVLATLATGTKLSLPVSTCQRSTSYCRVDLPSTGDAPNEPVEPLENRVEAGCHTASGALPRSHACTAVTFAARCWWTVMIRYIKLNRSDRAQLLLTVFSAVLSPPAPHAATLPAAQSIILTDIVTIRRPVTCRCCESSFVFG